MNNIEIKDLSKTYHTLNGEVKTIDHLTFSLKNGEFITIVGSSGCGKSTLLSLISGLDKDYKGIINTYNHKLGFMEQTDSLLPWLTVYQNAILGLKLTHTFNEENKKYVDTLLKKYHLEEFKDKYPENLSGGMKERVAIIRTLATKPDIILLDEPFSALDYQTKLQIEKDIYFINKKEKKTILLVTHDIGEAVALSDKVIVLSKRPTKIKNIYNIELENFIDPMENRKDPKYQEYYEAIWRDLDDF